MLVLLAISIAGALYFHRLAAEGSYPWYGRGRDIPTCRHQIVVGPADASRGVVGVVEIGMRRRDLLVKLGSPLVARMSAKEALDNGFVDPEDVSADFLDGVFAWVQYGREDTVAQITFDLKAFAMRLRGKQRVALRWQGHTCVLDEDTTLSQALKLFGSEGRLSKPDGASASVSIDNTTLWFAPKSIDKGERLQSVVILKGS